MTREQNSPPRPSTIRAAHRSGHRRNLGLHRRDVSRTRDDEPNNPDAYPLLDWLMGIAALIASVAAAAILLSWSWLGIPK